MILDMDLRTVSVIRKTSYKAKTLVWQNGFMHDRKAMVARPSASRINRD